MANVTEKDIIDHLKEKIKFHEKEVKRIENLLIAFTGNPDQQKGKKVKAEAVSEAAAPMPATSKKGKVKPEKTSKAGRPSKGLVAPEAYDDKLTLNEKIAFALKEIGSGFNEDIAKAMAQYQPQSDEKKISKQISGVLSVLKTKGQLKTTKEGRKDKYSLA